MYYKYTVYYKYQKTNLICSSEPPLVALLIAQAASFRVLNSLFCSMSTKCGIIPASITAWQQLIIF